MRLLVLLIFLLCPLLAGCVEVVDARPYGIWLQEPMISVGNPDRIAADHCASYGKRAVRTGQLGSGAAGESYLPITAYSCQ